MKKEDVAKIPLEVWQQVKQEVKVRKKIGYRFVGRNEKRRWMLQRAIDIFNVKGE